MRGRSGLVWGFIAGVVAVVAVLAAVVVLVILPQVQKVKADIVRFQKVAQVGPGPFTPPAEARASAAAALAQAGGGRGAAGGGGAGGGAPPDTAGGGGATGGGGAGAAGSGAGSVERGTFGGTGSNQVCDREKLIKALVANPDRLRAWAQALGIDPTPQAVTAYIRSLRPVTLTRDTQVTNHAFVDGRANAYQAIMQKGTAVLVDKDGKPVTRCRCGNPLTEPAELAREVKCVDCPPNYQPPPPCKYEDFDDSKYQSYNDQQFAREYGSGGKGACYQPVPDPPPVEPHDEPPDEAEACRADPSAPGCRERCQEDPSLPHCDGDQEEQTQDGQAAGEGEAPTGTEEAPSGGGAPSDGGTTPPDGGGTTTGGGTPP